MDKFCNDVRTGSTCLAVLYGGSVAVTRGLKEPGIADLTNKFSTGSAVGGCVGAVYHVSGKLSNIVMKRVKDLEIQKELRNFSELNNSKLPDLGPGH